MLKTRNEGLIEDAVTAHETLDAECGFHLGSARFGGTVDAGNVTSFTK